MNRPLPEPGRSALAEKLALFDERWSPHSVVSPGEGGFFTLNTGNVRNARTVDAPERL